MKIHFCYIYFFISTLFFTGCRQGNKTPDVSNIPMEITLSRFDREFMSIDTLHVAEGLQKLLKEYPGFFPVYMNQIMNFNYNPDSSGNISNIREYIASKDIRTLQDTVNAHFTNGRIYKLKKGLTQSFRYIKYYFPDFKAPHVITFTSALANYGAITIDSILGIGLDMFLGADFPLYQQVANPYPGYILKRFSPKNIVISSVKVIAQEMYPPHENGNLLEQMVTQGKLLYFMEKVLPKTTDAQKIFYTQKETDWCKNNEQFIWQYFIHNNLLYKKDALTIRSYIGPGPSSRGMPPEAPGNIGSWTGWQIVKKYMKKYPDTSLKGLMEINNAQKILNDAGYHPH